MKITVDTQTESIKPRLVDEGAMDKAKAEQIARRAVAYIYAAKYAMHCDTLDDLARRCEYDRDFDQNVKNRLQDCIDMRWKYLHPTKVADT